MNKSKTKKSLGKRILKGIGVTLASVVALVAILLLVTTVIHKVSLKSEAKRIENYGEKLTVFDGEMNIVDEGEGSETILLLPGQGTATPYLDFKPLVKELSQDYRVITIEPFGYGLSSQTKRERTIDNYLAEVQAVVQALKLDKYYIMGHSITGLYAANYAQAYSEEMKGFIGIDSSTPEQPWPGIDMRFFDFLKSAGIFRSLIKVNPEGTLGVEKSSPDFEQTRLLTLKNMSSPNMAEELQELSNSFPASRGLTYPKDMPVLLFVAKDDANMPGWLELHEAQVKDLDNGKLFELVGKHYLHRTETPKIAEETKKFIASLNNGG